MPNSPCMPCPVHRARQRPVHHTQATAACVLQAYDREHHDLVLLIESPSKVPGHYVRSIDELLHFVELPELASLWALPS